MEHAELHHYAVIIERVLQDDDTVQYSLDSFHYICSNSDLVTSCLMNEDLSSETKDILNAMMLRARFNASRNCEMFLISTEVHEESFKEALYNGNNELFKLIRERGHKVRV